MYKIFADNTLIYDSTLEDYKINKGSITLEVNKSGSFSFSIYPDHFYYDKFVRLKTVITVYKDNKIVFRGRILNDTADYWNNKVLTCEGELGFLQDSIIRPFSFTGTPEELFTKFIEEHNSQVDDFKKFKVGTVTVVDPNNYINRSNSAYESALSNLNSRLIEDSLGGYFYITHENEETTPTLNYLADFTNVSTQVVKFGSNLKNYTKTVKADDIATAIIPLGATVDDGDTETEDPKLTIKSVNEGVDYVYSDAGVSLYGWITKVVEWSEVTDADNLKVKALEYLENIIKQNVTIEINVIDLHFIDKSIEAFNMGDYIQVVSAPHNFDSVLLCNKQTIDLLKPENDSLTLGYTYSTFTEINSKLNSKYNEIVKVSNTVKYINIKTNDLSTKVGGLSGEVSNQSEYVNVLAGDIEALATAIVDNHSRIDTIDAKISVHESELYYKPGDTIPIRVYTGGFLTGSKKRISFDVSLRKSIERVTGARFDNTKLTIRQGGAYLYGSGSGGVEFTGTQTPYIYDGMLAVDFTFTDALDGTNNDNVAVGLIADLVFL